MSSGVFDEVAAYAGPVADILAGFAPGRDGSPGPAGEPGEPGPEGQPGPPGATTVSGLTDATPAFRALNVTDPSAPGNPVGDRIAAAVDQRKGGRIVAAQRGLVLSDPTRATANCILLNALLAEMAGLGGGTVYAAGTVYVDGPIDNKYSGVYLEGPAPLSAHDTAFVAYGLTIVPTVDCTGPSDGTSPNGRGAVLRHRTPYRSETGAATAPPRNVGGGFRHVRVLGNGVARRLLEVDSVTYGTYDLFLENPIGYDAAWFRSGVTGTDLGEAADVQAAHVRISVRCLDTVAARNAHGITLDGSVNANFSLNRDVHLVVQHYNGNALNLANADNNDICLTSYRGSGGAGLSVAGSAAIGAGSTQYCRGNRLRLSADAPSYFQGTEVSGATSPASMEEIVLDNENGTPVPTLGPGVVAPVRNLAGHLTGYGALGLAIADSAGNLNSARNRRADFGDSLRVRSDADNHIVLENGTQVWGINIDSTTGDLRFVSVSGSGVVRAGSGAIVAGGTFTESPYAKLRRMIAASRFSNPRTTGLHPSPPAVSVGTSQPAGLTNAFTASGSTSGVIRSYGGVRSLTGAYFFMASTTLSGGGKAQQNYRHETMVDAVKVAVRVGGSSVPLRFLVDGQYVGLSGTTVGTSGDQWVTLDFTSAGGRKLRRIGIEWSTAGTGFVGFHVGPTESCIQPAPPPLRGICFGDSYMAAAGVTNPGDGLPAQIGDYLGTQDMWTCGIGGTGYLNPGTQYPYSGHLADFTGNAPDFGIIGSASNDQFASTPTQITNAVKSLVQAIRAASGPIPLFLPGSWSNQYGVTASNTAADQAVGAAVTALRAAGDTNTWYMPVVADPAGSWITGTGNTGAPAGNGNADVYGATDGSHLNAAGWTFLAARMADQIATICRSAP